jgi:hypothetical protein
MLKFYECWRAENLDPSNSQQETPPIAGLFLLAVSLLFWRNSSQHGLNINPLTKDVDWDARREEVKEAFVTSWDAYSKNAWG